jgi:hypothetical protein
MFQPIWLSSSVKIPVLGKLHCSIDLAWSYTWSPMHMLMHLSLMGHCSSSHSDKQAAKAGFS